MMMELVLYILIRVDDKIQTAQYIGVARFLLKHLNPSPKTSFAKGENRIRDKVFLLLNSKLVAWCRERKAADGPWARTVAT
jgi:hypothetical protein